MKPLVSIQYLRAVAAIAVVMSHANGSLVAQSGVDIFFVISGFIMWTITQKPISMWVFLWHRLTRVAPLYWIATILMGLHQGAPAINILKSMLFIPFFGEDGRIWPVLVQGWTLNYELYFYVLIALTLTIPRKAGLICLGMAMAMLSLCHIYASPDNALAMTYTNPLILEFFAGVVLAEMVIRGILPASYWALGLIIVGAIALYIPDLHELPSTWRFLLWGVPSLFIVAGGVFLEARGRMTYVWPLLVLGDASYSIYLLHSFVIKSAERLFSFVPLPLNHLLVVVTASVLGIAVYYFLEKPMNDLLRGRSMLASQFSKLKFAYLKS